MRAMEQLGLGLNPSTKRTHKREFLDDMERVAPWAALMQEWKWNTPVWSSSGLICTGEAYKQVVKITFAKGASLPDPARLFNAGLGGKVRRAVDFREGDRVDEPALTELVRAGVRLNRSTSR